MAREVKKGSEKMRQVTRTERRCGGNISERCEPDARGMNKKGKEMKKS